MSGPLLRSSSMGERPNLVYEFQGYTPGPAGWRMEKEKLQEVFDEGDYYVTSKGKPRRKFRPGDDHSELVDNVWTDINAIEARDQERMGYATQKPLALLERIIKAGSNEGDVVLDPFCGCGTTLEAAQNLNRQWIGIDIAIHAVKRVAAVRLGERCNLKVGEDYTLTGAPRTLEGAKDLWGKDPYHFQKWAVEEIDGFVTAKRTADGGIDGRLYFDVPTEPDLQSMVIEVKGGKNVTIADLRALHSVLEREEALLAGLIIMEPLGDRKMQNFQKLMSEAGDLEVKRAARPTHECRCFRCRRYGGQTVRHADRHGSGATSAHRLEL